MLFSMTSRDAPNQPADPRSQESEEQDCRVGKPHQPAVPSRSNQSDELGWTEVRRMGNLRDGGAQRARISKQQDQPSCTGPRYFPTKGLDFDQSTAESSETSSASSCKSPDTPKSMPTSRSNDHGNQVSLTHTALIAWGQKVITWGRKLQGASFSQVFEQDPSYVRWILAKISTG